jgi:hypothetical protein
LDVEAVEEQGSEQWISFKECDLRRALFAILVQQDLIVRAPQSRAVGQSDNALSRKGALQLAEEGGRERQITIETGVDNKLN